MSRTLTALKTAAFGLVAAGLSLAGTGAANAQFLPPASPAVPPAMQAPAVQASPIIGGWATTKTYQGQSVVCYLALREDGQCLLIMTDLQGNPLMQEQGTFAFGDDVLAMNYSGYQLDTPVYPDYTTVDSTGRFDRWTDNAGDTWMRVM